MILSDKEIKKLIAEKKLIDGYLDLDKQTQPAGFDFTLSKVFKIKGSGSVDFSNEERVIPQREEIPFDESGWLSLKKGSYLVMFNEIVNIPEDLIMIVKPRSSLLRMGATLQTAFWDPGYSGRSVCLLVVLNEHGIRLKKDARIAQGVFVKLFNKATTLYQGIYKGENIE